MRSSSADAVRRHLRDISGLGLQPGMEVSATAPAIYMCVGTSGSGWLGTDTQPRPEGGSHRPCCGLRIKDHAALVPHSHVVADATHAPGPRVRTRLVPGDAVTWSPSSWARNSCKKKPKIFPPVNFIVKRWSEGSCVPASHSHCCDGCRDAMRTPVPGPSMDTCPHETVMGPFPSGVLAGRSAA